jgi:hypothetical protein
LEGELVKRLGDKGLHVLTLVHKGIGVGWALAVSGVIVLGILGLASGQVAWGVVAILTRIAATASVLMLVLGLTYGVLTIWGFTGTRWLMAKWALYLVAVATSGYTITATKGRTLSLLLALGVVQLAALAAAMSIGAHLERSRRAGRLPHARGSVGSGQ